MMMTCKLCDQPRRQLRSGKFDRYCEEHHRQEVSEYYYRNKGKRLAAMAILQTLPETKERTKRYYRDNRESLLAKYRKWEMGNPEKVQANKRKQRQRERSALGFCTEVQWQARVDFYGRRCYLCGCDWDALPSFEKTVEHVIPLSRNGTHWPANLLPACRDCNTRKYNVFL